MKHKLLIALLLITLSNQVLANEYTIFGGVDCGKWVKGQSKTPPESTGNKVWLLGYLSGLNADSFYKDALDKISSIEQIFSLDG